MDKFLDKSFVQLKKTDTIVKDKTVNGVKDDSSDII